MCVRGTSVVWQEKPLGTLVPEAAVLHNLSDVYGQYTRHGGSCLHLSCSRDRDISVLPQFSPSCIRFSPCSEHMPNWNRHEVLLRSPREA